GWSGVPKGVMVSHANLMHNVQIICYSFELHRKGSGLSWLPAYHDMGLVGGILFAMFFGRPAVLMSPMAFLQKPVRWLRGITKYGVSISGGPEFSYEPGTDQMPHEPLAAPYLFEGKGAFNGAEPVRADTLSRFSERFGPYGFRPETHYPCYGMAETTLIVTGSYMGRPKIVRTFDGRKLDARQVVPVKADQPGAPGPVGSW